MNLRRMRWWDIDAAHTLEHELFGADGWSPALFWSELAQRDTRHYFVALDNDDVVGYGGLAAAADEAYVQTIGVRRDRWGAGTGGALLAALLEQAGARPVLLEVRADNERAQRLYRRFGFRSIDRRPGYYQPSGDDAVVMRRG